MSSTIRIANAESFRAGFEQLFPVVDGDITLLPSSLRRSDPVAMELRDYLRRRGLQSHLLLPEPMIAAVSGRRGKGWRQVTLTGAAGSAMTSTFLPTRLADANVVWSIIDIDAVTGRGPYVLDLLARHADARTRLRLLGSKHRAEVAVAILQARPLQRHVIVRHFPSFEFLATCDDPIAAELLALSLVDEDLTRDHQVAGPWEDELVQRATELDLGVRLPQDISIETSGSNDGPAAAALARILGRIGIDYPR